MIPLLTVTCFMVWAELDLAPGKGNRRADRHRETQERYTMAVLKRAQLFKSATGRTRFTSTWSRSAARAKADNQMSDAEAREPPTK
ncbi:uncharacterized [Tachysurus ichikawai]